MKMRALCSALAVFVVTAAAAVGCGKDSDDASDSGLGVPDSILKDADLNPGTLKAYDAAALKLKMENGGQGNYDDNDVSDDDDDKCITDIFDTLVIEAEGEVLRIQGEVDFGSCMQAAYEKSDSFKGADFSGFAASAKSKFSSWIKCDGADLSAYAGKSLLSIKELEECNKSSKVSTFSQNYGTTDFSGVIKGVKADDGSKYDYTLIQKSLSVSATQTASGDPCEATLDAGVFTYADDCINTDRSVDTENKSGIKGQETVDEDVGKETYEKLEYQGIKQDANATSPWYSGGIFAVTYNDWTGTVKYSSGTAEPIFEMKKGTETVTGTIKAKKATTLIKMLRLGAFSPKALTRAP